MIGDLFLSIYYPFIVIIISLILNQSPGARSSALSDKGDWDEIVDKFIKEVYESEGGVIIDDCAGGERYSEI